MMLVDMNPWVPTPSLLSITVALGATDTNDVTVLPDLYRNLNYPTQLTGWKYNGGESCNASSVIYIDLSGLGLGGYVTGQPNLLNLKQLNLSSNHIQGEIPYLLPPNVTHIDLSRNNLSMNLPYSLAFTRHLRHLNVSHNFLSGPIGNIFTSLQNLKRMNLNYPPQLTGWKYNGGDPCGKSWKGVSIGTISQSGADYPPWYFSQDVIPNDQNIKSPPATESNAIENYPSLGISEDEQNPFGIAGTAFTVGGVALVATCSALIIVVQLKRSRVHSSQELEGVDNLIRTSINVVTVLQDLYRNLKNCAYLYTSSSSSSDHGARMRYPYSSDSEYRGTDPTSFEDDDHIDEANNYSDSETDMSDGIHLPVESSHRIIFRTENDWNIHVIEMDLENLIETRNIEEIKQIMSDLVGGDILLVRVKYLARLYIGYYEVMDLEQLIHFHHEYEIIQFYAHNFDASWPLTREKWVAVQLLEFVEWINIAEAANLEELRVLLVRYFGEFFEDGSTLRWISAKGEPVERDFPVRSGHMWRVFIHSIMKIHVYPPQHEEPPEDEVPEVILPEDEHSET